METLNYRELKKEFYRKEKTLNKRYGHTNSEEVSEKKKIERKLIANKKINDVKNNEFWKYLMEEFINS